MIGLRSLVRRACFTTRATASMEPISKHQDWESTVVLEDDGSGFFGPNIPLRRIEERGRTFLNQAKELSSHKNFEDSNGLLDRALDAFKSTFGEEYPELLDIYKTKARNFFRLKFWDQGFEWYHKAIEFSNSKIENRFALLEAYIDYAWAYVEQENYEKAEFYYTKIFDLIHNEIGKYHTLLLIALDDMAHMYHKKGDLDMALTYHYRALGQIDPLEVGDQPHKAKILTHIAQRLIELGDTAEALRCAKMAKEIYETSAATGNPDELNWCYNTIGEALHKEGKTDEANKYFNKSLDLQSSSFDKVKAVPSPSREGMKDVMEKPDQKSSAAETSL